VPHPLHLKGPRGVLHRDMWPLCARAHPRLGPLLQRQQRRASEVSELSPASRSAGGATVAIQDE